MKLFFKKVPIYLFFFAVWLFPSVLGDGCSNQFSRLVMSSFENPTQLADGYPKCYHLASTSLSILAGIIDSACNVPSVALLRECGQLHGAGRDLKVDLCQNGTRNCRPMPIGLVSKMCSLVGMVHRHKPICDRFHLLPGLAASACSEICDVPTHQHVVNSTIDGIENCVPVLTKGMEIAVDLLNYWYCPDFEGQIGMLCSEGDWPLGRNYLVDRNEALRPKVYAGLHYLICKINSEINKDTRIHLAVNLFSMTCQSVLNDSKAYAPAAAAKFCLKKYVKSAPELATTIAPSHAPMHPFHHPPVFPPPPAPSPMNQPPPVPAMWFPPPPPVPAPATHEVFDHSNLWSMGHSHPVGDIHSVQQPVAPVRSDGGSVHSWNRPGGLLVHNHHYQTPAPAQPSYDPNQYHQSLHYGSRFVPDHAHVGSWGSHDPENPVPGHRHDQFGRTFWGFDEQFCAIPEEPAHGSYQYVSSVCDIVVGICHRFGSIRLECDQGFQQWPPQASLQIYCIGNDMNELEWNTAMASCVPI